MKQRIILVAGLVVLLVLSTVATALALPGEGLDVEPFGGTGEARTVTAITTSEAAMTVTAVILITVLVGAVMAAGYLLGTARQRRVLAP